MTSLFIHPETEVASGHLPQGVLLHGRHGVGVRTLAEYMAKQHAFPIRHRIAPTDKTTIGIADIRELYMHARTRQAPHSILIDDADTMTPEAQHAFLKLLEEPAGHIRFLLTSHQPEALLATIRSRVQHVAVRPITDRQTAEHLKQLGIADAQAKAQLLFLATGRPAELTRLVQDDAYFAKQRQLIQDAKQLLQSDTYGALVMVYRYSTDRVQSLELLQTFITLLRYTAKKSPSAELVARLQTAYNVEAALYANGHVRTHLLRMIVGVNR